MKKLSWSEMQEMFDTEEVQYLVENIVDSPSETNVLCLIRHVIDKMEETQQ